jgi:tetratricopeptide (TPR) repeat protein
MNEALGATDVDIVMSNTATDDDKRTNLAQAAEAYSAAAAADPLDPEPHLGLAEIAQMKRSPEDHLKEINAALAICRTGKAYYRLGQYYMSQSEWAPACEAFEHARSLEPKMLQNLHALAQAYLADGKTDAAIRTLQTITTLQHTPYGEVRAMHESVETDFAYGHAMLGDIYAGRGDWQGASKQYELARDVLSEYWIGRHYLVNMQGRTQEKRDELANLFETVLKQLAASYTRLNRPADAEAAQARLEAIRKDRETDGKR